MDIKTFTQRVAENLGESQVGARRIINAVLDELQQALIDGEDVRFPDFGGFKSVLRKARKGFNPQTGEPIDIPECATVTFKPAKALKERMNQA